MITPRMATEEIQGSEAVVMDRHAGISLEVAVEAQSTIVAVVSTGAEVVEETASTSLTGAEVDTVEPREKKAKWKKMVTKHKIGEIPDQGVKEETSEVLKVVETLEVREDSVEPEAAGENVVEEDSEDLTVEGPTIETTKSTTTMLNIHSQPTKKKVTKKSNKLKSKSNGLLPRFPSSLVHSRDLLL